MKRRTLVQILGGASLLATGVGQAVARGMMGSGHNSGMMHDMQGMHNMGDMQGMMHGTANLMPLNKMPSQQKLQSLPLLKNQSSQAALFKANLEAKPVKLTLADRKPTEIWAYNGQIPGPQIVVYEGDTVEINFKNSLSQPTTVHWHGLPVPPDQDGNPHDAVAPGESRIYRFTLPKGSAGTYWYHPHPHGYVSEQVFRGLAGSFIVKAKDDPLADFAEQHWLISDIRLDTQANIPHNTMMDWMNGREGQFVLINGQLNPKISVKSGERIRIWNACSARYLKLEIPNCSWILVGTDGGLLEQPRPASKELFIAPAERVEVILHSDRDQASQLITRYYDRQKMMMREPAVDLQLATINVQTADYQLPKRLRPIADLGTATATKFVEFSEVMGDMHGNMDGMADGAMMGGMHGGMGGHGNMHNMHGGTGGHGMMGNRDNMHGNMGGMAGGGMMGGMLNHSNPSNLPPMMQNMFLVNGKTYDMQRMDLTSKLNEVEEWEVFNNSHMDHPFHLHGTQFVITKRVLNDQTIQEPYKALRDTFNLKPYERVTFKVKQGHKGLRVFHCHILEHETLGMMANLNVV